MCPYCGEDVPTDSARCWKCGTELSASAAGEAAGEGGPEGEDGAAAIEQRQVEGKGKKKPTVPCPHCEAPVSIYALRCNECGRSIGRPGRRFNWGKASWVAFAVVTVGLIVALVYGFVITRPEHEDRGRRRSARGSPIPESFQDVERVYLKPAGSKDLENKRREGWEDQFEGEYVAWSGVITSVDGDNGIVEMKELGTTVEDKPQMRLQLKRRDEVKARDLKRGMSLAYSARLVDYQPTEKLFELDMGVIKDE